MMDICFGNNYLKKKLQHLGLAQEDSVKFKLYFNFNLAKRKQFPGLLLWI